METFKIEWDWWLFVLIGTILGGIMLGQLFGSATAGITINISVFGPIPWKWMFFFIVWWVGGYIYSGFRVLY